MRRCSKPRCGGPASVLLAYSYGERVATLHDASSGQASPHLYALCGRCADGLVPPRGWVVEDHRLSSRLFAPFDPPPPVESDRSGPY